MGCQSTQRTSPPVARVESDGWESGVYTCCRCICCRQPFGTSACQRIQSQACAVAFMQNCSGRTKMWCRPQKERANPFEPREWQGGREHGSVLDARGMMLRRMLGGSAKPVAVNGGNGCPCAMTGSSMNHSQSAPKGELCDSPMLRLRIKMQRTAVP